MKVLLVEDNPGDVVLTLEAFKQVDTPKSVMVAIDGEQAMAMLYRKGVHASLPSPDVVLLDLNLPRKNGLEVLAEIKEDKDLKTIPVIILSTSDKEDDVIESYRLHANSYVTKPIDLDEFFAVIKGIESFWLQLADLPTRFHASAN